MPAALIAVTRMVCLPYLKVFLYGDVHGLARPTSTAQVKVAPSVDCSFMETVRSVLTFFGFRLTFVSAGGQVTWPRADWVQASWVMSP